MRQVKQADFGNQDDLNLGNTLRKISSYLFLALVCCLALVTFNLFLDERNGECP